MTALDLLGSDYYSRESAIRYWSISQFKQFVDCEARALAELKAEWISDKDDTALLVGNYVHSYFESDEAHAEFIEANKTRMVSSRGASKGQLKKEFQIAEQMIERLKHDPNFKALYQGEKEVAITGFIGGVEFKGKIDCLNIEKGYFVDIKTTKGSIDSEVWVQEDGQNVKKYWFEAYGYILQMAAYKQMLEDRYGKHFEPVIYAVTKETPSDTCAIRIQNLDATQMELDRLTQQIVHLDAVKKGLTPPTPCGACDYCREKQLTKRVMIY